MSTLESQKQACVLINRLMDNYTKTKAAIRPHFLVSGPSGVGKSFLLEQMARQNKIGFINVNGAQLTREGISGNSLSKALVALEKYPNHPVIVFIDEFDKLFSNTGSDERSGVQHELIHIISSGTASVIGQYGHYNDLNTSKVLFVLGGAFGGDENISMNKLLKMGIYPELLGRVNLHIPLPALNVEDLIRSLNKDPLLMQYFTANVINTKKGQREVKLAIAKQLRKVFQNNIIGYRLIQRLIHQYFLYEGKYPEEELIGFDLEDDTDDDIELTKELNFKD